MICSNCGNHGAHDDRFCEQCGAPLMATGDASRNGATAASGPAPTPPHIRQPVSESTLRYWAIGAHLGALVGGMMLGIPAVIAPLVVWLARRDVDMYAAAHARAALNFNVSVLIYSAILLFLTFITAGLGVLFTVPAGIVLGVLWFICSIRGAVLAGNDRLYRYPFAIQFLR